MQRYKQVAIPINRIWPTSTVMRCITAAWKEKKEEEKKNTKINNNVCSICYVMFKDVLENDVKIHTLQQIVLKVKKIEENKEMRPMTRRNTLFQTISIRFDY